MCVHACSAAEDYIIMVYTLYIMLLGIYILLFIMYIYTCVGSTLRILNGNTVVVCAQ